MVWNEKAKFQGVIASMQKASVAISCVLFLVACGDDSGNNGKIEGGGNGTIGSLSYFESFDDLPNCSNTRENFIAITRDNNVAYKCLDGRWETLVVSYENEDDIPNFSSIRNGGNVDENIYSSSSNQILVGEKSSNSMLEYPSSIEESSSSMLEYSSSIEESSSSFEFDWSLPKEMYLNPEIIYGNIRDSRDGKTYKTVKIGNQVWMAENLNYTDSIATPSLIGKNWCYDNKPENCDVAGRLYTWAVAIDSVKLALDNDNPQDCGAGMVYCTLPSKVQGICPDGWHLPTEVELISLFKSACGGDDCNEALINLMSTRGWHNEKNINTTNVVGFSALPVGYRSFINNNSNFYGEGRLTCFWLNDEHDDWDAEALYLKPASGYRVQHYPKYYGLSVRCLQD